MVYILIVYILTKIEFLIFIVRRSSLMSSYDYP
jgi:hypothetical protein